ncbi:hypothetical protein NCC78_21540 [Micromonospora phytophila]|uniref:hypothetical protein n=1 Tax=Micromonospora phytophila TaxID=709888 RepID=UPI002030F2C1|nr:hypothetical protein [Micromonospora phytophila]MCM0677250.1 hypothetical protein [Micromonospora phytophila]
MVSRTHRRAALAVALAAVAAPLLGTGPAPAAVPPAVAPTPGESEQPGDWQPPPGVVFVEVKPSTVEPGFLVGVRASCRDNRVPAIVVSDAFGRIAVYPQRGELTGTPMVRERTRPGNYRVKLECPDGATASTMLQVVKAVDPTRQPTPRPSRGPATGFGGGAGGFTGGLLLPGGVALTVAGMVVWVVATRRPRTVRGAAGR